MDRLELLASMDMGGDSPNPNSGFETDSTDLKKEFNPRIQS